MVTALEVGQARAAAAVATAEVGKKHATAAVAAQMYATADLKESTAALKEMNATKGGVGHKYECTCFVKAAAGAGAGRGVAAVVTHGGQGGSLVPPHTR